MKQQEEKDVQISERHHGMFVTHNPGAAGVQEQADFGKYMDEDLETDRIFSFLTKEIDELQLKMKEMADEYEKLVVMYEETVNEKDTIRTTLQKTSHELENSTKERTLSSREIEDVKSKLTDMIGSNEDMVKGNEKGVQLVDASNIDLGNSREGIRVAFSSANIGKFDAFLPSLHALIGEKLKALKEHEQQVQKLFDEMDSKLGKCGLSMDNLDMLRKNFEIDLDLIQGQVEKKIQAMQLEVERLEMRLQESEHSKENLSHLSSGEKGAGLPRDKDLITNQEKILQQEMTLVRYQAGFCTREGNRDYSSIRQLGLYRDISQGDWEF